MIRPGQTVVLNLPHAGANGTISPLHMTEAMVMEMKDWGAVVTSPVAATGQFRAHWTEMIEKGQLQVEHAVAVVEVASKVRVDAKRKVGSSTAHVGTNGSNGTAVRKSGDGYTGDVCGTCGGMRMRRAGPCLVCDDCGNGSGECG